MFFINKLSKTYKSRKEKVDALVDINLSLPSKGLIFIGGQSGSGKSTLLNILGGLDKPSSGTVYFNNIDLTDLNENELTKYCC